MKPINIIFTGLVRNPELFVRSIEDLQKLRQEKMINKIIFSTWIGEIDKYDGIRKTLEDCDCHIIESEQPPKSPGNVWHQMKALYCGMELIKDDSYCLKTRADLHIKPEFIQKLICDKDYLNINTQNDENKVFEKKIWIPYFEITKPFYMSDECFYGKAVDIRKLVNFDTSYDLIYNIDCGITHIRRFIHPFIEVIPLFRQYLKYAAYSGHFTPWRFEILEYNLKSDFYLNILASYYKILHTYFRVESNYIPNQFSFYHNCLNPEILLNEHEFKENFKIKKSWYPKGGHIYTYDEVWLDNLLNKKMVLDDSLIKLYNFLDIPLSYELKVIDDLSDYKLHMEKYSNRKKPTDKKQKRSLLRRTLERIKALIL